MRATVIGGGVVGLCAAVELARSGFAVTVLDRDHDRQAASWGNAGHIATEQTAPLASTAAIRSAPGRLFARGGALDLPLGAIGAWGPFAARMLAAATPRRFANGHAALATLLAAAMPAWRALAQSIETDDLLRDDGHFVAWEHPGSVATGRDAWSRADTGTARFADATPDDLATLRTLSPGVAGAIRFAGTGRIRDLARLADALDDAVRAQGGRIERRDARIAFGDGVARVDGEVPDVVVVAAGIGSTALMNGVGHRVPLIAERGYHIRAAPDGWPADLPPVAFEDRSVIVTRYERCVQVASFVEFNRADAPPDPRKWQRLEQHAALLGLPVAGPFRRWIGSRPTLPDYLPAIGRSRRATNLIYAFGHQHLGLTLAPATAGIVGALARGESPPIDIAPFDIARFGGPR